MKSPKGQLKLWRKNHYWIILSCILLSCTDMGSDVIFSPELQALESYTIPETLVGDTTNLAIHISNVGNADLECWGFERYSPKT